MRTPSRAPERILLLVGMAGFLVIGLSIPHAFGAAGAHGQDGLKSRSPSRSLDP
jgi:hypothetical protein